MPVPSHAQIGTHGMARTCIDHLVRMVPNSSDHMGIEYKLSFGMVPMAGLEPAKTLDFKFSDCANLSKSHRHKVVVKIGIAPMFSFL